MDIQLRGGGGDLGNLLGFVYYFTAGVNFSEAICKDALQSVDIALGRRS